MKTRTCLYMALYVLFLYTPVVIAQATGNATDSMKIQLDTMIEETEVIIDSLEAVGEMEEVLSCYRTILSTLSVARSQLDSVDALREHGPPE